MRWALAGIWLIFAILFLLLGRAHIREAGREVPPFEVTLRPMDKPGSGVHAEIFIKGADIDQPINDFARDFNAYLKLQNESATTANERAAYGYFLALGTALISMLFELTQAFRERPARPAQQGDEAVRP